MSPARTPTTVGAAITLLDRAVRATARNSALSTERRTKHPGIRDWTEGGCLVFAAGIARWLGRGTTFVGVREHGESELDHVAAVWQGLYFDALGCRDASDFEFDCVERGGFRAPIIAPIRDLRAVRNISHDDRLTMAVARTLGAQLDPQPSLSVISAYLRTKA